jgi:hypothetical protein
VPCAQLEHRAHSPPVCFLHRPLPIESLPPQVARELAIVAAHVRGMVDPVRQPREDLAVSRTLTIVALILVLAGCGGSDSESSDTSETTATVEATQTTTETTQTIVSNDSLRCLEEAGLSDVEERDLDFWRGYHDEPPYAITIHKLMRSAKVPRVVAGEYAVTGSFKVVAVGRGLSGDEGIQADALVQTVADCLGG